MKKMLMTTSALIAATALPVCAQTVPLRAARDSSGASQGRTWFPHNWVRGYADFEVAPAHNEPDLGRCAFPPPGSAGGANLLCTAYARYLWSGYLEVQPLGRTFARHIFLFFKPKFSFGDNAPQSKYTASMAPIAYERSVGVGIELPKNFEFRATQHEVDFLGRYGKSLGPADLHTSGPYGLYATFGVRWYFGGYGRARTGR